MKTYKIVRDVVFFLLLVAILIVGICCLCCCKHCNHGMMGGKYDGMHQFDEEFLPERGGFIDDDFMPRERGDMFGDDFAMPEGEYQDRPSRRSHERVNPEPSPAPVVESENTTDNEPVTQE